MWKIGEIFCVEFFFSITAKMNLPSVHSLERQVPKKPTTTGRESGARQETASLLGAANDSAKATTQAFPSICVHRNSQANAVEWAQSWCLTCLGQCKLPRKFCRSIVHRSQLRPQQVGIALKLTAPGMWPPSLRDPGKHCPILLRGLTLSPEAPSVGPVEARQILCQHLNAPLVIARDAQVHVTQTRIELHACPASQHTRARHPVQWVMPSSWRVPNACMHPCLPKASVSGKGSTTVPATILWTGAEGRWKSQGKFVVIDEVRTLGAKVHFASLVNMLKNAEWRQSTKNTKVGLLSKSIHFLTKYSPDMDHQHPKWQSPRSWISSPDCRVVMDKQQTQ